jgi:hypothetical protein
MVRAPVENAGGVEPAAPAGRSSISYVPASSSRYFDASPYFTFVRSGAATPLAHTSTAGASGEAWTTRTIAFPDCGGGFGLGLGSVLEEHALASAARDTAKARERERVIGSS